MLVEKMSMQRCLRYEYSEPFDKYHVPPGLGSCPVVSAEKLRTSPAINAISHMGRARQRQDKKITPLARLTLELDSEPLCFTPFHIIKGFIGTPFMALCFTLPHGYWVFFVVVLNKLNVYGHSVSKFISAVFFQQHFFTWYLCHMLVIILISQAVLLLLYLLW